jgi:hypothetical protein
MALVLLLYAVINLLIAFGMNVANQRLMRKQAR